MQGQPNIIFVMLDTVRADALGSYGAGRQLRNVDAVAKKSLLFENAIAPSTYTLPSHLSIFLGRRPRSIKALMKDNIKNYNNKTDPFLKKSSYLQSRDMTLAKHLAYMGYDTSLFSNNPFVSSTTGITDGFSHVDNMFVEGKIDGGNLSVKVVLKMIDSDFVRNNLIRLAYFLCGLFPDETLDRMYLRLRKKAIRHFSEQYGYYNIDSGAKLTNERIKRYLNANRENRNFMFVNYMEAHEGYPTNLITEREIVQDKWLHMIGQNHEEDAGVEKAAYLKRIEYLDERIGELLGTLKSSGILDNAYVVFAGDHGQAFMEHDQMYHNVFPYNEVIKVPLFVSRYENGSQVDIGKRVQSQVSLTSLNEILPDLGYGANLDELNFNNKFVVSDHMGITEVWDTYLLKLLKSRSKYANAVYRSKMRFNTFATAIFHKNYKLIHFYGKRKDELYSTDDLQEQNNILDDRRDIALKMVQYNKFVS
ncbi:MAG: sulfatase-like hydrolase/transferase [Candidatus Micrarchaeota archaeon]|nr:sulfatase-like hydrolase/transferase [Candidatus Micrarchaeota archaeon]MDE1834782.1 sulfatase-like hydrolase/transferase [Candidatus Micrarchaeota archaeon]MDE1859496.1 sulfatase-like hydrolase/transferase [Candidatus Micrarchaeota archaeon]